MSNIAQAVLFNRKIHRDISKREILKEEDTLGKKQYEMQRLKKDADKIRSTLANLRKVTPIKNQNDLISKMSFVDEVTLVDSYQDERITELYSVEGKKAILVRTVAMFANLRSEAGSRDYRRRYIGVFTLHIIPSAKDVWIINETETEGNTHWCVSGDNHPCWGDFKDDIYKAFTHGSLYSILEVARNFLISPMDGSAYVPHHKWLAKNRGVPISLDRHQHVYIKDHPDGPSEDHDGYRSDRHTRFAKVVRGGSGDVGVVFKHTDFIANGDQFNFPRGRLHPISEEEYNTEHLREIPADPFYSPLDDLPNGATLSDVMKIKNANPTN